MQKGGLISGAIAGLFVIWIVYMLVGYYYQIEIVREKISCTDTIVNAGYWIKQGHRRWVDECREWDLSNRSDVW